MNDNDLTLTPEPHPPGCVTPGRLTLTTKKMGLPHATIPRIDFVDSVLNKKSKLIANIFQDLPFGSSLEMFMKGPLFNTRAIQRLQC